MAYRLEYDPGAEDHLAALTARDEATVLDSVPRQLAHQPTVVTIRAVGIKDRNRVFIGGKEIEL